MFRLNFKAGIAIASKNSAENYYMIGLADDRYDYKNYLLFQRPIKLGGTRTQTRRTTAYTQSAMATYAITAVRL